MSELIQLLVVAALGLSLGAVFVYELRKDWNVTRDRSNDTERDAGADATTEPGNATGPVV